MHECPVGSLHSTLITKQGMQSFSESLHKNGTL